MMKPADSPLSVRIFDDQLVISIGVSTLAHALQNGPDPFGAQITDDKAFAADVVETLNDDSTSAVLYSGNTMLQELLSRAAEEAITAGSPHVVLDGDSQPSVYPPERS